MDNANNGMMTKVWGPPGWFFLHTVSFGFPVDPDNFDTENEQPPGTTKTNYKNFFLNIGNVLPCKFCRESYKKFVKEYPPDVTTRDTLVEWLWEIHNKVNEKLEDIYPDASLERIKERYERYRAKCSKKQVARGCSVPLSGRKMCSEVNIFYCGEKNKRYSEMTMFVIVFVAFVFGRIIFDYVADKLLLLI